ncbi:MAG: phosphonate C-P lyase system protein PhnH [Cyanobacteria bacterium P01_D01_bin.105]
MPATTLPGFKNAVHEAQRTFKSLLEALSHPAQPYSPNVNITPPAGLTPLCAAACLTLIDLETVVWLQPSLSTDVQNWLRFHTGCRFTQDPNSATFAVIETFSSEITLQGFNWGSAEQPEQSTTLLIQVKDIGSNEAVGSPKIASPKVLSGPGILGKISFVPTLPETFWAQWPQNNAAYPRGLDCFLFTSDSVVGLPRTTYLHPSPSFTPCPTSL